MEFLGRLTPAWICRIHGEEIKILKERDLARRKGTRTPPLLAGLNRIYSSYKRRCRLRNTYFELTVEQFHTISQKPCSYCGCKPANGGKKQPYIYNGIDRKNNERGYTLSNSIPCCAKCNAIKSNLLSFNEMRVAMAAILKLKKRK